MGKERESSNMLVKGTLHVFYWFVFHSQPMGLNVLGYQFHLWHRCHRSCGRDGSLHIYLLTHTFHVCRHGTRRKRKSYCQKSLGMCRATVTSRGQTYYSTGCMVFLTKCTKNERQEGKSNSPVWGSPADEHTPRTRLGEAMRWRRASPLKISFLLEVC